MEDVAELDRLDVVRVLAGDVEAFNALVQRHQSRVLAHVRRMIGPAQAEDICQDAFIRAYRALASYDPAYTFTGWLLVIASRLAINAGQRRRPERFTELADPADPVGSDPAEQFAEGERLAVERERFEAALAELSGEARMLYELRFRQEMPVGDIARYCGQSENSIHVRLHRLRQRLIARLGGNPEDL